MEATEREAEEAARVAASRGGGPGDPAASAAVSKTCGDISRRCSASPSFSRMKALVV